MKANNWADDENLKHDLEEYVLNNFKKAKVLDFIRKEYPEYTWSLRTLDRRLRYFNISYIDYQMLTQLELLSKKRCAGQVNCWATGR